MHAVTFSRAFEIAALPSPDPGEIFSDSGGTREPGGEGKAENTKTRFR